MSAKLVIVMVDFVLGLEDALHRLPAYCNYDVNCLEISSLHVSLLVALTYASSNS